MNGTILKAYATPEQRARYLEAGLETQTGLEEAIRLLKAQRGWNASSEERRHLRGHLLGLRAARSLVRADLVGFLSDSFRLRDLGPDDVDRIREHSRSIFSMLPGQTSIHEIVKTVDRLLDGWAATRPADERDRPRLRLEAS
jgi:hypothetical protein